MLIQWSQGRRWYSGHVPPYTARLVLEGCAVTGVSSWGLRSRSLVEDPGPLTGDEGGHRGGFSEVKIPHSLVFLPKKLGAF